MDSTAAATVRMAAASKLLLGVGIIGAIAYLVVKLNEYSNAQKEAAKISREVNDARMEGLKNAQQELVNLKLLYQATQNANLPLKERKKAVDELQDQYPAYFKNMKDEKILAGEGADAYDRLTKSIINNSIAQAGKNKIVEIATGMLDAVVKVNEANALIEQAQKGVFKQDKIVPKSLASGNTVNVAAGRFSTDEKDIDKAVSAIKTKYAEYFTIVEQGNKRIDDLVKGLGITGVEGEGGGGGGGGGAGTPDKSLDKALQEQLEWEKRKNAAIRQMDIDAANERIRLAQKTMEDENAALFSQIGAAEEIASQKRKLAVMDYDAAIQEEKKIEDGKIVIVSKSAEEKKAAKQRLDTELLKISEETTAKEFELQKNATDNYIKELERQNEAQKNTVLSSEDAARDSF